jgi:CheY-like chemotaxis protein
MSDTAAGSVPPRRPPGVLVAEDQAGLRAVLCLTLAGAGFRAWPAADGEEAVRLYREHRDEIDAALLDRHMPRMGGVEALAELRALDPDLPCCLMTGDGPGAEAELLALGANRVFAKPFDLADMVRVMRELSAGRGEVRPTALRVLTAEGDPDTAAAFCRLLALWGHETRAASAGPEALAAAAEFGPDVVLLDLDLPGLDAVEVARRLHELPGLKGVVFVALTDYSDEAQRRLLRQAGFALQVVKPPDLTELETVLGVLAREKAERSQRAPE